MNQNEPLIKVLANQATQSWSYSKHRRFLNYRRAFVFTDVVARMAKRKDASPFEKKVFQLAYMMNIDMLFGISLHNQVYEAVKGWFGEGRKPNADSMYSAIRNELNQAFKDSKSKCERWGQGKGQGVMLQEIYYDNDIPEDRIEKVKEKMHSCTTQFCESYTMEEITSSTDIRFDHAERNRTMILDGIRVKFVTDLVYDHRLRGEKVLVDWKSGVQSMEDFYQLCLYALYFVHVFKMDVQNLTIVNEYLNADKEKEQYVRYKIALDDLDRIKDLVMNSVEVITDFLNTERIERAEDVLLLPEAPNAKSCNWCNFRELCLQYKMLYCD
jgi:CRISPR/Cas system-associated exonuclease Cas4 (RecB family)